MKTKYGMSRREIELVSRLEAGKVAVFTLAHLMLLLGLNKSQAYNLVKSLVRKGIVVRLSGGRYALERSFELFEVASNIVWPSYVSFWAVLNRYGFTEQVPYAITVVSTRSHKPLRLSSAAIKFVKFKAERFFGYTSSGNAVMATREKAIIDSLFLPKYSGGISEVVKCLNSAWQSLDKERLIGFALKMKSKALAQRLGYLIEESRLPAKKSLITRLHSNIGSNFIKLEPNKPKEGVKSERWKIINNCKNLFEWKQK